MIHFCRKSRISKYIYIYLFTLYTFTVSLKVHVKIKSSFRNDYTVSGCLRRSVFPNERKNFFKFIQRSQSQETNKMLHFTKTSVATAVTVDHAVKAAMTRAALKQPKWCNCIHARLSHNRELHSTDQPFVRPSICLSTQVNQSFIHCSTFLAARSRIRDDTICAFSSVGKLWQFADILMQFFVTQCSHI